MLMTSTAPIDVSGLRGLHIPATPDIFPLAIGWWLVIILLLVVIFGAYFAVFAWGLSLPRQVEYQLKKIRHLKDNRQVLTEINRLAKRVAIARFGREKIAALYEAEWVDFMNSLLKEAIFSKEYVDLLHKNIYAESQVITDSERQKILHDYEKWIKKALKKNENRR